MPVMHGPVEPRLGCALRWRSRARVPRALWPPRERPVLWLPEPGHWRPALRRPSFAPRPDLATARRDDSSGVTR